MIKKRILIVEDERIIAEEIKKRLQKLGYDVLDMISTGKKAISKAEELKPDIILMDIKLKGKINGLEAARQIKEKLDIPIIYLTSHSDDKTLEEAKLTEPSGYLIKPINERELHSVVQTSLYKFEIEQKLKKSEKKFRSLYSSMNEGVCLHEIIYDKIGIAVDYKLIDINPAYETILDIKRNKAVGSFASELYGIDKPPFLDIYSRVADTMESIYFETYFQPMEKYFNISVFSPEKGKFATIFTDITKRKNAEEKFLFEKNKLQTIMNTMENGVTIRDLNYEIIYQNDFITNIFGNKIGEKCYKVFEGIDHICNGCPVELAFKDGKSHTSVRKVLLPSGEISYWENIANPIRDSSGKIISCLEINMNITDRKKIEKIIIESEKKYKTLLENINDAVFILDLKGNIIETNIVSETLLGYSKDDFLNMRVLDFNPKKKEFEEIIAIPTIIKNGFCLFEDTFEKKDGSLIQVEVNAKIIEYKEDKVIHAVVRDVTEKKKMELQIKEYTSVLEDKIRERTKEVELEKEKYKSLFEGSNDPIYIINPKTSIIIDCNNKAKMTCNCDKEECCNKKFYNIYINEDKNIVLQSLKKAIKEKNANFLSLSFSQTEDKTIFLETNLTQIEFENHKIIQAICRDITDNRKIENGILKKALRYELDKGSVYLIDEPLLDESLDIFNNLLECGFNGHLFSRSKPEILRKKIKENSEIYWMAEKRINKNTISPNIKSIKSKIENLSRGNNTILLDRFDYLLTKNSFTDILKFLQRIAEFIYLQKWILLISIDSRIINKKDLNFLKKEAISVKPKQRLELDKRILSILKYINNENKLGKLPSLNEISGNLNISRDTTRKRINLLERRGLIKIVKTGRSKLLEITDKGKENI